MPTEKTLTVYLFFGENTYLSNEKLRFWQDEFIKKYSENSNIEVIEGSKLDTQEFLTNLETLPFLTEKRLIIIKDFLKYGNDENQKKVAEGIERTPDFCIVVFYENEIPDRRTSLFQKIKKIGKLEEFNPLTPNNLISWIAEEAKKSDTKISGSTASFLVEHCGTDMWHLSSELSKLSLFAGEKEITREMIENLTSPSLFSSIFKLTDLIAAKDPKNSLKILKILLDSGEELTKIFYMIVRHFRILIQVKDLVNKNEPTAVITKKLKQHPFVIQTSINQCKNFDLSRLEQIYGKLLKIDIAMKTGGIKTYQGDNRELILAIEKLIISCCQ